MRQLRLAFRNQAGFRIPAEMIAAYLDEMTWRFNNARTRFCFVTRC
jgi:hypothetical protein